MTAVNGDIFLHLGIIVILAALAAFVLRMIKQSEILAYVLTGILITPVFQLITDTSIIESMSTIGIAFLLFIVGIEIDLKRLKDVALVSTVGGAISITLLFLFGYLLALLLGYLNLEAAYIGLMLAFSSTMVILKLLSDKRELNTLHGRIIIGILLLEDIVAIFALTILSTIDGFTPLLFGIALLKFGGLFGIAFICSKYIFPRMFKFAAKNQELLLITSLAICFIFSLMFHYLGFSIAIGAFLAGVALGNLEYNIEIIGKVKSLRDFFALLFFVSLGMGLSLAVIQDLFLPLILFLLFAIFFKPLLIMVICSIFKYTKKPSFLSAISMSNIGEFSLIIAAHGLMLGHLSQELFSLVVIVTLTSITITSYLVKYDDGLYRILEKPLKIFDKFTTEGLEYLPTETKPTFILCGHNRIGYSILRNLHRSKKKILVVDFNPEIISRLVKKGYHCIYGEVTDEEIIERMNLEKIKMLVSTVPGINDNLYLIKKTRRVNKKAKIIVTALEIDDALRLYKQGADYVILPHFLGGEHVATLISNFKTKKTNLKSEKEEHIEHLKERKEIGHQHPTNG